MKDILDICKWWGTYSFAPNATVSRLLYLVPHQPSWFTSFSWFIVGSRAPAAARIRIIVLQQLSCTMRQQGPQSVSERTNERHEDHSYVDDTSGFSQLENMWYGETLPADRGFHWPSAVIGHSPNRNLVLSLPHEASSAEAGRHHAVNAPGSSSNPGVGRIPPTSHSFGLAGRNTISINASRGVVQGHFSSGERSIAYTSTVDVTGARANIIDSGLALSTPVNSPSASAPAMTPGRIDNYVYSSYEIGRANPYAPERIAQYEYQPHSKLFIRHPPVNFMGNGNVGINAKRALDNQMGRLSGPDDPVFIPQFANDKLMLRILLIGHKEYRHQFNVYRTVGRKKQPITRAMLAHKMAKELEIYLKPTNKVVDRSSPDAAHALGPIDLKHILILGVNHVAQGSVQLDLALLRV